MPNGLHGEGRARVDQPRCMNALSCFVADADVAEHYASIVCHEIQPQTAQVHE